MSFEAVKWIKTKPLDSFPATDIWIWGAWLTSIEVIHYFCSTLAEKQRKAVKLEKKQRKKEKWEQEGEQRAGNLTRLPYELKKACGIFWPHIPQELSIYIIWRAVTAQESFSKKSFFWAFTPPLEYCGNVCSFPCIIPVESSHCPKIHIHYFL